MFSSISDSGLPKGTEMVFWVSVFTNSTFKGLKPSFVNSRAVLISSSTVVDVFVSSGVEQNIQTTFPLDYLVPTAN